MTKRSPIVNPEEPDDTIRFDATKIDAGTITANNIVIGEAHVTADSAVISETLATSKYIMDRYGPITNPRSSTRGLYQPITPTWHQTGDDND